MPPITKFISGILRDGAGDPVQAYYQAYFDRNNASSDPSQWDSEVKQTAADGYYSVSLGNATFLGDGLVQPNDKVVVAAWIGEATRLGTTKTHCAYREVTLQAGIDTYSSQDITVMEDQDPSTSMSAAASVTRLSSLSLTNSSTDNSTSGSSKQHRLYESELVFDAVGVDHVDVDWGDSETGVLSGTSSGSHTYDDAGGTTVTITATATDVRGNVDATPWTQNVNILWRAPTYGLDWAPKPPTISDLVTFTPAITDPDSQVTSVDYSVDSVTVQTGLGVAETWQHTFATNGDHTVRQTIHWHDGFAAQQVTHDFTVSVSNILPTAGWSLVSFPVSAQQYTWTSTSTDPDGGIASYSWVLERSDHAGGWNAEASASGSGAQEFTYRFSSEDDYRITLTVTDVDGGEDTFQEEFFVTISGGGGARVYVLPSSEGIMDVQAGNAVRVEIPCRSLATGLKYGGTVYGGLRDMTADLWWNATSGAWQAEDPAIGDKLPATAETNGNFSMTVPAAATTGLAGHYLSLELQSVNSPMSEAMVSDTKTLRIPLTTAQAFTLPAIQGQVYTATATQNRKVEVMRGDTPTITFSLDEDYTGWTAWFGAKEAADDDTYVMAERELTWTDASAGTGTIPLTSTDTATAGTYQAEIELRNGDQRLTAIRWELAVRQDVVR